MIVDDFILIPKGSPFIVKTEKEKKEENTKEKISVIAQEIGRSTLPLKEFGTEGVLKQIKWYIEKNIDNSCLSYWKRISIKKLLYENKKQSQEEIEKLQSLYKADPLQWQKKWSTIQERIIKIGEEISVLKEEEKQIKFTYCLHSANLPLLLKIPTICSALGSLPSLFSEKKLLRYDLAFITQEFGKDTGTETIDNVENLLGYPFNYFSECLDNSTYNDFKSMESQAEKECYNIDCYIKTIKPEDFILDPTLSIIKKHVIKILLFSKNNSLKENLKDCLLQLEKIVPRCIENWESHAPLVGFSHECLPKANEIKFNSELLNYWTDFHIGQVGLRCRGCNPVIVMIARKLDKYELEVIINKQGDMAKIRYSDFYPLIRNDIKKNFSVTTSELACIGNRLKETPHYHLTRILNLFHIIQPVDFSPEEKEIVDNSFPIIWASSTAGNQIDIWTNKRIGEGTTIIGKDFPIAFVEKIYKNRLQKIVKPYGVKVLTIEAAFFLHIKKFSENLLKDGLIVENYPFDLL